MTDNLGAMTVKGQHEGGGKVRVVLRPPAWATVIPPARSNCRTVKRVNRGTVGRTEAQVRAGNGYHLGFLGDGEFDPRRARCCTVIGAASLTEIDDADETERAEYRVVEAA